MSVTVGERPALAGGSNGGVPARRAVIRWAWRLLRREWRQQLLILALITVAVAATFVGSAVATNTPPPAGAGFGTAADMATFSSLSTHVTAKIAALAHRFGRVEVIENQALPVPGSVTTYSLRAQNPHGAFSQPMLSLVSGHYPRGTGQVALTGGVASELHLGLGGTWRADGSARRVVGIVTNPQNLLDEFALVAPGQVSAPTLVTVLFDAPGVDPHSLGPSVASRTPAASTNVLNPVTISLAAATLGMLLIALVGVAGFTVLAQRRLRSIGMLGAQGATDARVRLVVSANGYATGVVGAGAVRQPGRQAEREPSHRADNPGREAVGADHKPDVGVRGALRAEHADRTQPPLRQHREPAHGHQGDKQHPERGRRQRDRHRVEHVPARHRRPRRHGRAQRPGDRPPGVKQHRDLSWRADLAGCNEGELVEQILRVGHDADHTPG